jgi:hypothetical protein
MVYSDFSIVQFEIIRSGLVNSWSFIVFLISIGEKVFQNSKLDKECAQIWPDNLSLISQMKYYQLVMPSKVNIVF